MGPTPRQDARVPTDAAESADAGGPVDAQADAQVDARIDTHCSPGDCACIQAELRTCVDGGGVDCAEWSLREALCACAMAPVYDCIEGQPELCVQMNASQTLRRDELAHACAEEMQRPDSSLPATLDILIQQWSEHGPSCGPLLSELVYRDEPRYRELCGEPAQLGDCPSGSYAVAGTSVCMAAYRRDDGWITAREWHEEVCQRFWVRSGQNAFRPVYGRLAVLHNDRRRSAAKAAVSEARRGRNQYWDFFWVGAKRDLQAEVDGGNIPEHWLWLNGRPLPVDDDTLWKANEPNNFMGAGENCGELERWHILNGRPFLNDQLCDAEDRVPLCEFDLLDERNRRPPRPN